MCGIGGVITVEGACLDIKNILNSISRRQSHRGPDDNGVWINSDRTIGLCHQRLAIVGSGTGSEQPARSEDGRYTMVFNGEIFNWKEIRKELEEFGVQFYGNGDTELLIRAYTFWGLGCISKLRGMFAFFIHDREANETVLVRDRLGKKPLVYAQTSRGVVFASEIPGILSTGLVSKGINKDAVAAYMVHNMQHIPDPYTGFKEIRRLKSGHFATIRDGRLLSTTQYWKPTKYKGSITSGALSELIDEAVRERMVADVEVGALLSGGVDSTAIVGLMRRHREGLIRTYAFGKDADDEDLVRARIAAEKLGTNHKELYHDQEEQWEALRNVIRTYGDPIALLTLVHAYQIAKAAKNDNVSVLLGGHGADEIFCGYTGHAKTARIGMMYDSVRGIDILKKLNAWNGIATAVSLKSFYYGKKATEDWAKVFNDRSMGKVRLVDLNKQEMDFWGAQVPVKGTIAETSLISLMVENTHSVTTSGDLPGMMASVEMRCPFLDEDIVRFGLSAPVSTKIPFMAGTTRLKMILKEAVSEVVPHELLYARKRGFGNGISFQSLLRHEWKDKASRLMRDLNDVDGLLDAGKVRTLWEDFQNGKQRDANIASKLICLQLWLKFI